MATMFTGDFVLFCLLKTRKGTKWHSRGKKYTCTTRHPSWKRRPERPTNGTPVTRVITETTRRETWQAGIHWTVVLGTTVPGTGAWQTRTPWTSTLRTTIPRTADSGRRQRARNTVKPEYQPWLWRAQSEARKGQRQMKITLGIAFHIMLKRYGSRIFQLWISYFGAQT